MKKWLRGGIALCLSAVLLAGCSLGLGKNGKENDQPTTLKVMYYDESSFFQDFGMLYNTLYPNVEIEVVNSSAIYNKYMEEHDQDYNKALAAFIEDEQPDVLMLDPSQVSTFINDGKLYDLDSFVTEKSYNSEGLVPGIIDSMKELGSGKLYALPTSFNSQVMFYNKDLFDQYGVPYPTDQMTWTDFINLAKQFPVDSNPKERVFGLKIGWSRDLNELVNLLATADGLQQFDPETLQMTIDTPAWAALIEQAQGLLKSDSLFFDDMQYSGEYFDVDTNGNYDWYSTEPFFSGRLAMRLESNYYIGQIEQAQSYAKDPESIVQNWDMVTAPVNSTNPEVSNYSNYYNLFAINANSTNSKAAWDFIAYVTGDDYARVKSKVSYGGLPIRSQYIESDTDKNYAAFYKLKPSNANVVDYNKVPQVFSYEFYSIMSEKLIKVNENEMTIADALAELQIKGNELLSKGVMTQEELEKYWNDRNNGYTDDTAISEELLREASGEASTEESVDDAPVVEE